MNKLLKKLAATLLGFAMAAGVGVAVSSHKIVNSVYADSVSSASWTNKSVPSGWSVSDSTKYEFSTANNSYLKMWGGAYLQYDTLLRIDNQESFTISVQMQSFGSKSGTSFDLKGGLYNSSGTLVSDEKTFTAGSKTTNNFVLTPLSTAEYVYLRVYSSSSATSGTCTRVFSTSATYTAYSDTPSDNVTLNLSTNSLSIDLYTSTTAQLTATAITTGSATSGLSAVSSDTSVATISTASPVSGTAFTVTGKKVGSATITVTSTWDSNKSKTCTVTVTDSTPVPASETLGQDLDGKTVYIKAGNYYLGNDISSSATGSGVTTTANAKAFLFTLSSINDTYEITDASDSTKYLNCTTSNGANVRLNTTACTWTLTEKTLASGTTGSWTLTHTTNQKILTCYESGPNWRIYNAGSTSNRNADLDFPVVSNDPEITAVSLTGSPATSASIGGGSTFKMTATVTAVNDDGESLSRNVNWTVSPAGAVTFSKNPSASGEEITVTAVNTANSNVKITASSAATGFTSVYADSNEFNIVQAFPITSVSLSATTTGGPNYNAGGNPSFTVGFTTSISYESDTGSNKVNITVSPNAGVTGYGDNVTAGSFDLVFTQTGNYTITSTAVENSEKSASVSISITNIVVPTYTLVTDPSQLTDGTTFVIVGYAASTYRIGNGLNSGHEKMNVVTSATTISDGLNEGSTLTTSEADIFTLVGDTDNWEIKRGNTYLQFTGGSNGNDSFTETSSADTKFTISGDATIDIISNSRSNRYWRYNTSTGDLRNGGSTYESNIYMFAIIAQGKTISSTRMTNGTVSAKTNDSTWTVTGFKFFVTYEGESETEVTSLTTFAVTESVPTINENGTMEVTVTPTFKGVTYTAKAATITATLTFVDQYSIARLYDIELALNGTQADLTCDGIYMGYITHTDKNSNLYYDLFIGNGNYGMEIYGTTSNPSSYTVGETYLTVTGTLKNYNYLYEMTEATVSVLNDATRKSHISAPSTYVVNGTESADTLYLASRKTSLSGTVYSINDDTTADTTATSGSNNSVYVTVGETNVLLYVKAAQATSEVAAKIVVGQSITVEGFTTYFKNNNQATFEVLFEAVVEAEANYHAADFARDLLKLTRATCAASDEGNGSVLTGIWTTLAGADYWLKVQAAGEASTLVGGTPDFTIEVPNTEQGIMAMNDSDAIAAALARYDWCTAKYELTNFIVGRTVTVSFSSGARLLNSVFNENTNTVTIIVIISMISMTAIGGYFFLRKRKENI